MIITFYSYKGGVGRSMALSNIAEIFFQAGKRVLLVDWDLEAPGLDRFFFEFPDAILDHRGLIDMLLKYKKTISEDSNGNHELAFDDVKKYIVEIPRNNKLGGKLFFMPAGKRSGDQFPKFAQSVVTFDWQDFFKNWNGELYFEWLREQFSSIAEIILIDSRTGVTEMGGVCTYQLADTVIMFCAPNDQNINGIFDMAINFTSKTLYNLRPDRPLNVLIVPSRVEYRSEIDFYYIFKQKFIEKFDVFLKLLPKVKIQSFWDLKIPYVTYYSFNEQVAIREEIIKSEDLSNSYYKIASVLNELYYMNEEIHILHLSDLHFGTADDAERWYSQLAVDLTKGLNCQKLDGLIISGDIASKAKISEYDAATIFIEKLSKKFNLDSSQLVIVPGNHDLSWSVSKNGYKLINGEDFAEGNYIEIDTSNERVLKLEKHEQRFNNFNRFYKRLKSNEYPLDYSKQAIIHKLPNCNFLILSLNSSWEIDHHFKKRISINPVSIEFALNQIRNNPDLEKCIKIAVWHHSFSNKEEDRIVDDAFMQSLAQAGFEVCLHGHIHKPDANLFRYDMTKYGRKIHILGAGTFGAPVREWTLGYPLQYNLLRFSGNSLRVETRCRMEINDTWGPAYMWRQGESKPNLPYFVIQLSGQAQPEIQPENQLFKTSIENNLQKPDPHFEAEIKAYCQKTESLHENLPIAGFATQIKVPIDIEDIYIPLRAIVNLKGIDDIEHYGDSKEADERLAQFDSSIEISLIEAFKQAERRGRKGLIILGDPGSGKTTHMKRMLLWCLRKNPEAMGLPREMLPVFLPLRELKELDAGLDRFIQDQLTSRHLKMASDFGKRMIDRGNLLFLLDGLDEVADLAQREEVSSWIEEAFVDYPNCRFVVTCRYAGYSQYVRLSEKFLEMHVRPLSEQEAEKFIRNWYTIVENSLAKDLEQAQSIAQKNSNDLIERLTQPDFRSRRIFELARNPLLLTNICLVHRDRGRLPQRRALLYEDCIDVLLEYWRKSKNLKLRVDAFQGRQVLQPVALWLHEKEGRTRATSKELAPIIQPVLKKIQWSDGDAFSFLKLIRDESGLLTGWDQENYGFIHLGFQEYLAAKEIRSRYLQEMNENNKSERLKNLACCFGKSWWQEVVLLLLALEDPSLFSPFMREIVQNPAFANHNDLMEMCLDESVQSSVDPFLEILYVHSVADRNLWDRQLFALRIVKRLDEKKIESILPHLKDHPDNRIREWIRERSKEAGQTVIKLSPSEYEMVFIKSSTFMMGSHRDNMERPIHEVNISDYYIGRYPVTNKEYGRFIKDTGYKEPKFWGERNFNQPYQPVVGVSWDDAKAFADWAGLQLPSEAQWEYACRAGSNTKYFWGDETDCNKANYGHSEYFSECKNYNPGKPSPVGNYPPNAFGLYDMLGNVWEWCEDHWHDNYNEAPNDGSAWVDQKENKKRVLRGGSWDSSADNCKSTSRIGSYDGRTFLSKSGYKADSGARNNRFGFRLALLPGQSGEPSRSGKFR